MRRPVVSFGGSRCDVGSWCARVSWSQRCRRLPKSRTSRSSLAPWSPTATRSAPREPMKGRSAASNSPRPRRAAERSHRRSRLRAARRGRPRPFLGRLARTAADRSGERQRRVAVRGSEPREQGASPVQQCRRAAGRRRSPNSATGFSCGTATRSSRSAGSSGSRHLSSGSGAACDPAGGFRRRTDRSRCRRRCTNHGVVAHR